MADPLKLLREYALEGKEIREKEGLIVFGDLAFEASVKTNFKVYGKASEYYDLQSIYFFYRHSSLIHTAYVKEAASNHIQPITRPDRKDLSLYLTKREAKPPASIDVTAAVPVPVHLRQGPPPASSAQADPRAPSLGVAQDLSDDPAAMARERERLERILDSSLRPTNAPSANIRGLSTELTADKVKELKMKAITRRRGQIQTIGEEEGAGLAGPPVAEELDASGRERVWRTRTTVLEASTKNFAKSIFPILQAVKNREEGRSKAAAKPEAAGALAGQKRKEEGYNRYAQDKYRKEETAGFQIDTVGTFHGMTLKSVTEGAAKNLRPTQPSPAPALPSAQGAQPKKRVSRTPIIIIPATTNNSLISMFNAKDILEELRFVSSEEKRAAGAQRSNEVLVARQRGGVSVPYRVVDNPLKLGPDEWERVVAVFVQGPAWQFKGWPHKGNPVEVFAHICAFHLKWEDAETDANVAKWNVHVLSLARSKRHLDRANLLRLWHVLDTFIAKHKSHLRT